MSIQRIDNNYKNTIKSSFGAQKPADIVLSMKLLNELLTTEQNINKLTKKKLLLVEALENVKPLMDIKAIPNSMSLPSCNNFQDSGAPLAEMLPGYYKQKNAIRTLFTDKIKRRNSIDLPDIPSAFIVYGEPETTNAFIKNVFQEIGENNIYINNESLGKDFFSTIKDFLSGARDNFFHTGKRTAILIDKPEKYFSISINSAKEMGIELDSQDKEILKSCDKNMSKISYFKTLLDDVSKLPELMKNFESKSAATFIMTTENPHLIHPDLISHNGKATLLDLGIPRDENLKDIIKYFALNNSGFIENDLEIIPWKRLINELNPNKTKGGLSVNNIQKAVSKSFNLAELISTLISQPRDILPQVCQRFYHINKNIGIEKNKNANDSIDLLLVQKRMGLLTSKSEASLKSKLEELKRELENINAIKIYKTLSKKQQKRLTIIEKILNKI